MATPLTDQLSDFHRATSAVLCHNAAIVLTGGHDCERNIRCHVLCYVL
jgi:hypothetical protein